MSDVLGIINCGIYAEDVSQDEEQYALENGWIKLESPKYNNTWCQGRQTRSSVASLFLHLKSRHDYSSYHDFDDNKTSIKISPWDKKRKVSFKDPKTQKYENKFVAVPAFGLS